jgi:penicillin-binding protein 2
MNQFEFRKYIIGAIFTSVVLVLLVRLFYIQVIDKQYKLSADNNSRRYVTQYPARGIIYDRNGKILVYNEAAYDLMVTPVQLKSFDTLEFCSILNITREQLNNDLKVAIRYSKYKPSVFLRQMSPKTYAVLQEKLYKFPGFYAQPRTLRDYPLSVGAHILGYVSEVDSAVIKRNPYYKIGDYVGFSGVEKTYDPYLRGRKGVNIYLVDVHNRIKGSFEQGKYDTTALVGKDLISSIDADLQAYGEKLMGKFKGSIVVIEPSTGEILALISSPAYDPNLLVGRIRNENYVKLLRDSTKPLFNRALMAKYPPGSTFKMVNGLIGLQEGTLVPETRYSCSQGYHAGNLTVKCHSHASPLNLIQAIQISCNAYFCNVFRNVLDSRRYGGFKESYDLWRSYVMSFGFGKKLDSDLPGEVSGNVPSSKYYDRYFGKNGWHSLTVISLAIGQGELGITPLQMCNYVATIANRGYYYTPHIVKSIQGMGYISQKFKIRHYTKIDQPYFDVIIQGMEGAVIGGTARVAKLDSIVVCAKTGTAQNPHGKDHSIFIAFAPKDHPKIAISVVVENAGFGATYAAPIASLMMEKYLTGTTKRPWLEERILSGFAHGNE